MDEITDRLDALELAVVSLLAMQFEEADIGRQLADKAASIAERMRSGTPAEDFQMSARAQLMHARLLSMARDALQGRFRWREVPSA